MTRPDYSKLPENFRDGMKLYIEHGIQPGSFLLAVLQNNLLEAVKRSGDGVDMRPIVKFLYNEAPAMCFENPDRVRAWIHLGGAKGIQVRSDLEKANADQRRTFGFVHEGHEE